MSTLALRGGVPIRNTETHPWPKWPVFDAAERDAAVAVIDSGQWWYGKEVMAFEAEYAAYQNAAHCVSCSNGTVAIEIAVQALGIKPGDEVIVPPYTFVSTCMAPARMGAIPVFADVNDTWCLDPGAVEAAITERTRAIIPVHFGSSLADMDRLRAIAAKHGLKIIEDACHSWGSKWNGKGTGALGDCGVFSFQQSKNLTAAEGGAILSDNEELAELCRSITHCGRVKGAQWFEHPVLGTNARITEIQAAMLRVQLARLDSHNARRTRSAAMIAETLAEIDGLDPQPVLPQVTHRSYHLLPMRFDPARFGCSRDAFAEAAQAEGLPISKGYFVPLYKQKLMTSLPGGRYDKVHCPVAEDLCANSAVWLHHSILLGGDSDIADICAILRKVKANAPLL